ncbi:hypothetical protein [Psychroserpens sp. NJDZ02]|uniref:hypothetical protein n=1 Tax=Psychroserpens sp. NJDZ02 TaxID=2570561 RepID=UPI0010A8D1B9|nr:hypothetical protein [Psychroserpens sp. NJDZ02]QCE43384.1 hypothetical protein E9099_18810 [Psychroserpens sp. NJDZ02]
MFSTNKIKVRRVLLKRLKLYFFLSIVLLAFSSCSSYKIITDEIVEADNIDNVYNFGKYIWSKNKDSTLVIHKKNLQKIYRKSKTSSSLYFGILHYYSAQLASKEVRTAKNLTFSERTIVLSYVIEFLYKCKSRFTKEDPHYDSEFIYRFLSPWNNNKFNAELQKNDYYELELLKEKHLKYYRSFSEEDKMKIKKTRSD